MWTYHVRTGKLFLDGTLIDLGYSGNGSSKNDPDKQGVKGSGPIPCGLWKMIRLYDSQRVGKKAIELQAQDGNLNDTHEATGRASFRIHGDSVKNPGTASDGCIILPLRVRLMLWNSADHFLNVVGD